MNYINFSVIASPRSGEAISTTSLRPSTPAPHTQPEGFKSKLFL